MRVQYSADNSSWHDSLLGTDLYIRTGTLTPPSSTWVYSSGTKFIPELGVEYENGIPGLTAYLHTKYSDDGGTTFTASSGEVVGEYIGTYSDNTAADSTTIGDYTWAKIKGEPGYTPVKGTDYFDGDGGQEVRVQYSINGSTSWHDNFAAADKYIRTDTRTPPSSTWVEGTAAKFIPELGVEYENGDPGVPSYLHIKYSDDGGTTFTASSGEVSGEYIGTYSDENIADSTNVNDYTWAKIKGARNYSCEGH